MRKKNQPYDKDCLFHSLYLDQTCPKWSDPDSNCKNFIPQDFYIDLYGVI